MPAVSAKQERAMHAAASGKSALGIPAEVGREFIGEKPMKKKAHRGRKPSTKPGSKHLSALQKAHGEGKHAEAKVHALNYANAVHKHLAGMMDEAEPMGMAEEPELLAMGKPSAMPKPPDRRAQLARIAMSRRK